VSLGTEKGPVAPGLPVSPSRLYRRVHWSQAPLVALDFETTGLDLQRDAVISFGAVPVLAGRVVMGEAQYQEIAPAVPPSHRSIAVHQLRPQDLAVAPGLGEVAGTLRVALDRRYLLTWTAEVETAFLTRIFGGGRRRWMRRTIDVWRLSMRLDQLQEPGRATGRSGLAATAERHGVPVEDAHHALDDAVMTAELFLVIAAKLAARGYGTVAGLLRVTRTQETPVR
jgi:DNA polymerase-3 subunit epsilon